MHLFNIRYLFIKHGNICVFRETQDPSLNELAARYIQTAFSQRYFQPQSLFIVTWDDVGYYSQQYDKVMQNSSNYNLSSVCGRVCPETTPPFTGRQAPNLAGRSFFIILQSACAVESQGGNPIGKALVFKILLNIKTDFDIL